MFKKRGRNAASTANQSGVKGNEWSKAIQRPVAGCPRRVSAPDAAYRYRREESRSSRALSPNLLRPCSSLPGMLGSGSLRALSVAPRFVSSCRRFHSSAIMSNLSVQLTAPNGRTYTQPTGLFINNEFVPSKSGEKFASINPSYVMSRALS